MFTLSAIDEIQAVYGMPVGDVLLKLNEETEIYDTLAQLSMILINDEIERENYRAGTDNPAVTIKEIKWAIDAPMVGDLIRAILKAYGYSVPEADEDEDPNAKSRSRRS